MKRCRGASARLTGPAHTAGSASPNTFPRGGPWELPPASLDRTDGADFKGDAGSEISVTVPQQSRTKHFPLLTENQKSESTVSTTLHLGQSKISPSHLFSSLQSKNQVVSFTYRRLNSLQSTGALGWGYLTGLFNLKRCRELNFHSENQKLLQSLSSSCVSKSTCVHTWKRTFMGAYT